MPRSKNKTLSHEDLANLASTTADLGAAFSLRRIYLIGEVDEEMSYHFLTAIHSMELINKPIQIILSSGGGSESDGYAIYDSIRMCACPTEIIGLGECCSIAAMILQAGDKRLVTENCRVMIHDCSISLEDGVSSSKLTAIVKEIEHGNSRYQRVLSERSKLNLETVKTMCNKETWFSSEEALAAGLIDAIVIPNKPNKKE